MLLLTNILTLRWIYSWYFVSFILQLCFHPACHFHHKLPRVQWATGSLVHHWWAMGVSVGVDNETVKSFLSLFMSVCEQADLLTLLTSMAEGEEEEVAEGIMTTSEDKVATWGSHTTWGERAVCVMYNFIFYHELSVFIELWIPFSWLLVHQNVSRWSTQHHWISWPGRSRRHGLLLEHSLSPFSVLSRPVVFFLLSTAVN